MATVVRSSVHQILLALQQQAIAVTAMPLERVVIDTEDGEQEADDTNYQREQLLFLRTGTSSPEVGYMGMGRLWPPQRVPLHVTLWTRAALDEQPGYQIGLTDPDLGHHPFMLKVIDAFLTFPPADADSNWIVQQPLEPGPVTGPMRKKRIDYWWAKSVADFTFTYAPAVNQTRQ